MHNAVDWNLVGLLWTYAAAAFVAGVMISRPRPR